MVDPLIKKFWDKKSAAVKVKNCGRHNYKKHSEIKNGEQNIALGFSLVFYCMFNREVKYLESRDYIGISGKGLSTSLTLRTKSLNNNHKARTSITDINNQYFRGFLKDVKDSP